MIIRFVLAGLVVLVWIGLIALIIHQTGFSQESLDRLVSNPMEVFLIIFIGLFVILTITDFIWRQIFTMYPGGNTPVAVEEVKGQIRDAFAVSEGDTVLFDVKEDGNKMLVSWSGDISQFQLVQGGKINEEREFQLTFMPGTKTIGLTQVSKSSSQSVGIWGFFSSFGYSRGLTLEVFAKIIPSFGVNENGRVVIDMKKLSYNSNDILSPILHIAKESGWKVQVRFWDRVYKGILIYLVISLIMAAFFAKASTFERVK